MSCLRASIIPEIKIQAHITILCVLDYLFRLILYPFHSGARAVASSALYASFLSF